MSIYTSLFGSHSDADFLGWQETLKGNFFPLFNITVADHPAYHSTVSEETLRGLGLRVPRNLTPYPEIVLSSWPGIGVDPEHTKSVTGLIDRAGMNCPPLDQLLKKGRDRASIHQFEKAPGSFWVSSWRLTNILRPSFLLSYSTFQLFKMKYLP
jgi:hypothetical protein